MEDITNLKEQAEKALAEAENLEKLKELYPDLHKVTGRWNKIVWCTPTVNSIVANYDKRHNCGCCPDSPLEIWPYLETPYGKVYSDPACFKPGEKSWSGGDRPNRNWHQSFLDANINPEIIKMVKEHFRAEIEDDIASHEADIDDLKGLLDTLV